MDKLTQMKIFLEAYEQLCRKHGYFVCPGEYGDALAYIRPVAEGNKELMNSEFWFNDHLGELQRMLVKWE